MRERIRGGIRVRYNSFGVQGWVPRDSETWTKLPSIEESYLPYASISDKDKLTHRIHGHFVPDSHLICSDVVVGKP